MLTLGSLFDGSGGFCLAAWNCGIKPVWASEIEPYPIKVTTKRLPEVKHLGDINKLNGAYVLPVDIITFGSPCQNLSVAGDRSGLAGEKSSLFHQAVRVIKEMRDATSGAYPRYIVWENVEGALSSNKGEDFNNVLEQICKIKDAGISISKPDTRTKAGCIVGESVSLAWRVLDAQYFGVPQRRKRIFLVADFGGERAADILFERQSLPRSAKPSGKEREETPRSIRDRAETTSGGFKGKQGSKSGSVAFCEEQSPTLLSSTDTHVMIAESKLNFKKGVILENHSQDGRIKICDDNISPTLNGQMGTGGNNTPLVMEEKSKSYAIAGNIIDRDIKNGGNGIGVQADLSYTLTSADRHGVCYCLDRASFNQGKNAKFNITVETEKSPTIVAKGANAVAHKSDSRYIIRRLTPLECCRLQGFPDWWCEDLEIENPTGEQINFWRKVFDEYCSAYGKKKKTDKQIRKWLAEKQSDSARYKMWGNGIALPCAEMVLRNISIYETS